jgi:hypothetical protein
MNDVIVRTSAEEMDLHENAAAGSSGLGVGGGFLILTTIKTNPRKIMMMWLFLNLVS